MKKLLCFLLACAVLAFPTVASANQGLEDPFGDDVLSGDVNLNGKLDALDYLLLKRYVLEMIDLNEQQLIAADMIPDGKIDARDYVLLKRTFLAL